jgi:3-oxoacyl-(acyl-carrier-protein) synthase
VYEIAAALSQGCGKLAIATAEMDDQAALYASSVKDRAGSLLGRGISGSEGVVLGWASHDRNCKDKQPNRRKNSIFTHNSGLQQDNFQTRPPNQQPTGAESHR